MKRYCEKATKEEVHFCGRVMSRLAMKPIYMTQSAMAEIWDMNIQTVGNWLRKNRGY